MINTFKGITFFGVFGCAVWFWWNALATPPPIVKPLGISMVLISIYGCGGWIFFKVKESARLPAVTEAMSSAHKASGPILDKAKDKAAQKSRSFTGFLKFLFTFEGVIKRRGYLFANIAVGLLLLVWSVAWNVDASENFLALTAMLVIAATISLATFGVRRCRDTGVNPWWFLLIFVPALNLAAALFLLLVPTGEFADSKLS